MKSFIYQYFRYINSNKKILFIPKPKFFSYYQIKTFATGYTNKILQKNYNTYDSKNDDRIKFLLQIVWLDTPDNPKIKETYLQAYYTNDMKLKIRFTKTLLPYLLFTFKELLTIFFGNDKNITIDVSNPNVLGIRNKNDNPVKITMKPR